MSPLTRVTLSCVATPQVWLRFGRPLHEDHPDASVRRVYFMPGAVFARMQRHRTGPLRLAVLRATGPGERQLQIAGIEPGAQLLLHASTTASTEKALQAFAAIEAQHIPLEDVSEAYWQALHQRLVAGIAPPTYTAAEHAAMRQRRELTP